MKALRTIHILSADERVRCTVEELAVGRYRYTLWQCAGPIDVPNGASDRMWRRLAPPAFAQDWPLHVLLDHIERAVRPMTHDRPVPRTARKLILTPSNRRSPNDQAI